jgi:hypothetical protein
MQPPVPGELAIHTTNQSVRLPSQKRPNQPDALDNPTPDQRPQALPQHHQRRVVRSVGCNWSFCPPIPDTFTKPCNISARGNFGDFLIARPALLQLTAQAIRYWRSIMKLKGASAKSIPSMLITTRPERSILQYGRSRRIVLCPCAQNYPNKTKSSSN